MHYDVESTYTTAQVNEMVSRGVTSINGVSFYTPSFKCKINNTSCSKCGLRGTLWAVTRDMSGLRQFQFNLFAVVNNRLKLITADHIVPKSRGGHKGSQANLQTMCITCNMAKGCKYDISDVTMERISIDTVLKHCTLDLVAPVFQHLFDNMPVTHKRYSDVVRSYVKHNSTNELTTTSFHI